MWPKSDKVLNGTSYNYIIVGAGSAGCILAKRLSEDDNITVLLIEAGGDPPLESVNSGLFTLLPSTIYDWNFTSINDHYTAQKTKTNTLQLTAGRMLGGSTSLHHLIHARGHPTDYDKWAEIIGDNSWNFENFVPYLKKPERLIAESILQSPNANLYGTKGEIILSNDPNEKVDKYLKAFQEIGHEIKSDYNGIDTRRYSNTVLYIADGVRQSAAEGFLKNKKPNLNIIKQTEVTKILIDENKNAIGVQTRNEMIYANIEVIISAGALNTPKLLMLSGIGPKNELKELGIEVLSDVPVGENVQDHPGVLLAHKMGASSPKEPFDPRKFPPSFMGFATLGKEQFVPDYQNINLVLPHNSIEIIQICIVLFNFKNDICQKLYNASVNREILLTYLNILRPESRGKVKLKSKNFDDPPLIFMNTFSKEIDLNNTVESLLDYIKIGKSTYFIENKSEIVDLGIEECKNLVDFEFWKCYSVNMVGPQWHFSGTCAIGSVVDRKLNVFGVNKLRIVDASVMPTIASGNINSAVMGVAEKAADLIKIDRLSRL